MKKACRKQDGPSKASLEEIPEVDLSKARVRRNPYAKQIAADGGYWVRVAGKDPYFVRTKQGRPENGAHSAPSSTKSVRFSEDVWKAVRESANARGITLHAALREAIVEWLKKNAA